MFYMMPGAPLVLMSARSTAIPSSTFGHVLVREYSDDESSIGIIIKRLVGWIVDNIIHLVVVGCLERDQAERLGCRIIDKHGVDVFWLVAHGCRSVVENELVYVVGF